MSTAVEFSFTGFLPWGSERSNPSQELVQEIREKFTPENIRVLYTRVIPVTAKAASAAVHNLHTALRLRREEYPEITQVLIHIGLHGSSTQFYLERRGVNEARIKGEVEGRIIPEFARDHHLVTTLKLQAGYPQKIKESEDAGLFVCNYTYYLSLLAEREMEGSDVLTRAQQLISSSRHLDALELLESTVQSIETPSAELMISLCDLCNSIGMSFLSKGDMASSLELLKRAETLVEGYSETRAAVMNNLACYYRKMGKPRMALVYLEKAQEVEARVSTKAGVANTHLNYCAVLSELGRHAEALTHIMKAVVLLQDELLHMSLRRQAPSEDNCEVLAVAYHNYAVELEFQKAVITTQYSEALSLYRKAAEFSAQRLSPGNKVRVDLERVYAHIQPQLTNLISKSEKKLRARKPQGHNSSYLPHIRRRISAAPGGPNSMQKSVALNRTMEETKDPRGGVSAL